MLYGIAQSGKAVAYCALSIKSGTRSEGKFPEGIAHFTEHTIFKGTRHKSSRTINNYLERLGGDLNAYTTREEIVVHAMVLKEDLWRAASLLLELATEPAFPEAEIEKERGVVIDEILSYRDSPSDDIFDSFEERLFAGHPLSRKVLGTEKSVRSITAGDLRKFTESRFIPEAMAFTIVSPEDPREVEQKLLHFLDKVFAGHTAGAPVAGVRDKYDGTLFYDPVAVHFDVSEDKDNNEANAVIGVKAPSPYEGRDRLATILLSNMLGGPASNSLLNERLRERRGWVYGVDCAYSQYSDAGDLCITLGCEKENLPKCLRAISLLLGGLREHPFSESRLLAAKKQFLGQLAIANENGESLCLALGWDLLKTGRILPDEVIREQFMSVTSGEILELCRRLFVKENISKLIYV